MDEDSSGEVLVSILRDADLDVVTVYEAGLERTDDERILTWAHRESRLVVTANKLDFLRIALAWAESGRSHTGIVIRYPNQAPQELSARAIVSEIASHASFVDTVLWARAE